MSLCTLLAQSAVAANCHCFHVLSGVEPSMMLLLLGIRDRITCHVQRQKMIYVSCRLLLLPLLLLEAPPALQLLQVSCPG